MNKNIQIYKLDGGMLFELNKLFGDIGSNAILYHKETIINIYTKYLNLGCDYITTCNYGFKSLKYNNWKLLIYNTFVTITNLKKLNIKNNNYKILCCLPPYYESYQDGKIDIHFIEYYKYIIKIMDNIIDAYIIETAISPIHISQILKIIEETTKKKVIISIYPNNLINKIDLQCILNLYNNNILGLTVNCCSFNSMIEYYKNNILELNIDKNILLGFYCNMLNEIEYNNIDNNKKVSNVKLQYYKNNNIITKNDLNHFFDIYTKDNSLLIGGCCGYGINEMKILINLLDTISS